ncbi:MFS transporter [Thalassomonas viridans]|uniref:MFS transporter n=2 Tax=Thalassomonas viridans TaxID=137584 RepID=A0AAF0CDH3_9GAMM|nr:MFS transporter [Thalassomonas viridans]
MAMVFSLSPLAIDMYLPALPAMAEFFGSDIDAMEGSVAVYLIGFALGQLVFGALADAVHKLKLLAFGLIVFAAASVMIGSAATVGELYFFRALQAFAGGSSVVVYALIQALYGDEKPGGNKSGDHKAGHNRSGQIISYVMACVVVAPMLAPVFGSQLLALAGWSWIFYALAVFALLTLVLQAALLSAAKVPYVSQSLKLGRLLFGYRQVLTNGTLMAYVFAGGCSFAGLFAFVAGSPFVYIEYFGVSPGQYAWLMALNAVAMIGMNLTNARLLTGVAPTSKLIFAGYLLALVGGYLFLVAYLQLSLAFVVAGVVAYMGLLGLTAANAIAAAMAKSGKNAGVLSGINGVLQFGLGALSSAVVSISASTSAMNMNGTMAVCALSTLVFALLLRFKTAAKQGEALYE